MKKNKKECVQTTLFHKESNFVSMEKFKEIEKKNKRNKQHEKKFMNEIISLAKSLDLPTIHIEYFCGNKFYPSCSGTKFNPHKPVNAVCPICHKPVLAKCLNIVNKKLGSHYDILGINFGIECKHKVNKGKQIAKGSFHQQIKSLLYDVNDIPHITVNEDDMHLVYEFLKQIKSKKELLK